MSGEILRSPANSDNHGIYGNLYVNCLYTPSPSSSLVTQEIWDDTENLDYWVLMVAASLSISQVVR
jgi:hypothetical protein